MLDAADAPVLQVALAGARHEAWEASARGLGPSDLAMNVVLPEVEGRIFTRAVSFKADAAADPLFEHAETRHEPAADRVVYVAKLAAAWARLSRTPRDERKLAIVLSDYPARGGRSGYAVGLDSFDSVREILRMLREEGYDAGAGEMAAAALVRKLSQKKAPSPCPSPARGEGTQAHTLSPRGRGWRPAKPGAG